MADDTTVRQRKPDAPEQDDPAVDVPATPSPVKKKSKKSKSKTKDDEEQEEYSLWVDILRVLSFLAIASCGVSYLMSGGESYTWGFNNKPRYIRLAYWKTLINGPLRLTPQQLLEYDGSNPDLPIYLAINHTIYDVSPNPRVYGPGGSYSHFTGRDCARAFVTGCFRTDRTPDMRGVEEMYLPLDDPAVDAHWAYAEMEALREHERQDALDRAHKALKHWVDFFANSEKYLFIGYVDLPEDWQEREAPPPLCEQALKGRTRRKLPGEEEEEKKKKEQRIKEKRERKKKEKEVWAEAKRRGEL